MNAQSPKDRRAEWEALLVGQHPLDQLPDYMQELLRKLDALQKRAGSSDALNSLSSAGEVQIAAKIDR
jgi:hypothetical protein